MRDTCSSESLARACGWIERSLLDVTKFGGKAASILASSAERPIHLGVIYVNQAVDLIYRLPMTILLLSRTGPLRQDFLGLQLLPTLVMAQSMIKKALLPLDPILSRMKMFPIANDAAHRFVPLKRQERVNMIGHEEKSAMCQRNLES